MNTHLAGVMCGIVLSTFGFGWKIERQMMGFVRNAKKESTVQIVIVKKAEIQSANFYIFAVVAKRTLQ